jgi:hypothetical protein
MKPQHRKPSFQAGCSRTRTRPVHLHKRQENVPGRVSAIGSRVSIRESEVPLQSGPSAL